MRFAAPTLCLLAAALVGCGGLSARELPPAATPPPSPEPRVRPAGNVVSFDRPAPGRAVEVRQQAARIESSRTLLRLDPRARQVTASGAQTGTVGAGVGPVAIVSTGEGSAYVSDAVGDGVVVLRTRPTLAVTRRIGLPGGGPTAMTFNPWTYRLWVLLPRSNEVVEIQAGSRPRELRRYPTVKAPRSLAVTDAGRVLIGNGYELQTIRPAR